MPDEAKRMEYSNFSWRSRTRAGIMDEVPELRRKDISLHTGCMSPRSIILVVRRAHAIKERAVDELTPFKLVDAGLGSENRFFFSRSGVRGI